MSRRMEDAEKLAKPAAFTVSVYAPTGRLEKWNAPSPEDLTLRVSPVWGLVTLTSAPVTKEEDGSVIRPSRVPVGSCAFAVAHSDANSKRIAVRVLSVMKPLRVLCDVRPQSAHWQYSKSISWRV